MLRFYNRYLPLLISILAVILAMDSKLPKKLNANAPEFRPAASTTSLQQRQINPVMKIVGHADEQLSPEIIKLQKMLPDDRLFEFDQKDWWENATVNEEETKEQGGSISSSSSDALNHELNAGRSADSEQRQPIKEPVTNKLIKVKIQEKMKENYVKSSDISMHKMAANDSEKQKGDESGLKVADKNEADFAADELMKLSLKEEVSETSLEVKKPSEERQLKSGEIPKVAYPIEMTSAKKEEPAEFRFGSSAFGDGLIGMGHHTQAEIEQKADQPFLDKNKQKEASLTNIGQKHVEKQHQQEQRSSSSKKIEKEPMNIDEIETKSTIHIPMGKIVQGQSQQAVRLVKEHQPDSLPLESGQAHWASKKQLPSSSPNSSSPADSSPLSAGSTVPTSHSIISSHSTPSIRSIQPLGSSSNITENKFELLNEQEGKGSQETEDKRELEEHLLEKETSGSEMHQGKNAARDKSAKSTSKKKKKVTRSSTDGKSKKEDDKEMKFSKAKVEEAGEERRLEQHLKPKQEEWHELDEPANGIISQIKHIEGVLKICQRIAVNKAKKQQLRQLKEAYFAVMNRIKNFVLKCGDKYGKSRTSYIGDLLQWVGQVYPAIGGNELEEWKQIMRDSFVYLDSNGGLTPHFKEPGQQQNILDDLFENISKLDEPIANYELAKNKGKGGAEKAAELVEKCYERDVDNKLREVIGYLYIDVKKGQGEDRRANKITFDQTINCLARFRSVLPNRTDQIFVAIETICKLFNLPNFQLRERNPSSSGPIEVTIPLSKLEEHILQPYVADSAGSGSSSHQTFMSNTTILNKSDSSDSDSFNKPMTPEKLLVKKPKAPIEFNVIVEDLNLLQSINEHSTDMNLPPFVRQSELDRLGPTYRELMQLLENFTNIYGINYNWNGNIYFGAIFTWIDTTFEMVEGIELPKNSKAIMHKSLILLDQHGMTNFKQLLEDVTELKTKLAEYHSKMDEKHGIDDEGSQLLFKQMETFYMEKVDADLREAFSFQFIGMRKTIAPLFVNVERMRKSVAKVGLFSLMRREHEMPEHRGDQFKMAQKTLELFFDTWTAGLEIQIRADLPGYVAKLLGYNKEERVNEQRKKGRARKTQKETANNWLSLEKIADKCINIDAHIQQSDETLILYGNKLLASLNAINELLKSTWEPSRQSPSSSSSTSSKKDKNNGKGKANKAEKEEEMENIKEELMINLFDWRQVLEYIRTLIRYIKLLSLMQVLEGKVNTKVDGLHVHVRVWAILFEEKISPILDEWNHNLKNQTLLKDQGDGSIKQYLEFLAKTMGKFLAENGQSKKGEQIKEALEILLSMEQIYAMGHRNKHLSKLLANNACKNGDGTRKYSDAPSEDDHFKNCRQFDHLLLD